MRVAFAQEPRLFFGRPGRRLNSLLVPDLLGVPTGLGVLFCTLRFLKSNDQNAIVAFDATLRKLAASFYRNSKNASKTEMYGCPSGPTPSVRVALVRRTIHEYSKCGDCIHPLFQ